jgi:hypothetical protein
VLHYELHKNIALQRRVTLNQADKIRFAKEKIVELEKQLAEAQSMVPAKAFCLLNSDLETYFCYLNKRIYFLGHCFIRARNHVLR